MGFLADFNFVIQYRPGAQNRKADILSHHVDHLPPLGGGAPRALLSPKVFLHAITSDFKTEQLVSDIQDEDECLKEVLEMLRKGELVKGWELKEGIAYFRKRIFVPKDDHVCKLILKAHHDTPAAGHPGQKRTLELISQ